MKVQVQDKVQGTSTRHKCKKVNLSLVLVTCAFDLSPDDNEKGRFSRRDGLYEGCGIKYFGLFFRLSKILLLHLPESVLPAGKK